ncbi:ABC transporter ATP-binding protein [Azorhizobium oxalatiphilum]|uniref:ABC transporter ATP-binding protein n=1 Tax=Azorhizobium oxalatiphilum TaxID=980631 RepID=A0A917FHJ2_9HYPH|nr:ATP-binding cassette domain-containing protein [Azorhizobium oxalatiphilum]GGF78925.1 ABC transporter ATP-binding protein [Azorhizobium oxalatiphilum]
MSVPAPPALSIAGVGHAFGDRPALVDVSLELAAGSFTALLGQNGAGKSTLFALITRLYDNVSGEIRVFGHDVRRAPSAALRQMGVVFQSRTLDADLSALQNLTYHGALHGYRSGAAKARAMDLLRMVGLAHKAHDKVRALSGGQARRVEIARALLHGPRLLLLDEATVGLDMEARESIIALVRDLVAREGLCILWATHLIDEIAPTDRIVVLHRGRVLFGGGHNDLLARTGAATIRDAFTALIRAADAASAGGKRQQEGRQEETRQEEERHG